MKTQAIVLVAAAATMTLLTTGCSAPSQDGAKSSITVMWQSNGDNSAIPAIAKAFEVANPNVTVEVKLLTDSDLKALIGTQLPAGNGPDVFMVSPGSGDATALVPLAEKGLLAELDGASWASKLDQGAKDVASVGGHLYGLVPTVGAEGAIYNTDAMSAAGLTIPTTWDELLAFCGDAKAKGTTAFGLGLKENWPTRLIVDAFLATTVTDPQKFNQSIVDKTFDYSKDDAYLSALTKFQEMDQAGCFNPSPVGTSIDTDTLPAAANGKVLATVTGAFHLGSLVAANPAVKVAMAPLPASNTESENKMQLSYSNPMVVNAKSKNLEVAKKFADFFGEEASLNALATQYQLNPMIPNSSYTPPAALTTIAKLQTEDRVVNVVWLAGPKMSAAAIGGIQTMLLGTASPSDVAKQTQDGYNADNGK